MFEKYTAFGPARTFTTASTWSGWRTVDPKCYGCAHSSVICGALVCSMASRTVANGPHGDTCMSYLRREVI